MFAAPLRNGGSIFPALQLFGPLVSTYEADIDRFVAEGRVRAADMVNQHGQQLRESGGPELPNAVVISILIVILIVIVILFLIVIITD